MRRILKITAAAAFALAPALAFAAPNDTTIPDGTIGKAGAALHDVAKVQEKYQGKLASATPAQKEHLSAQANAEAVQAVQSHGISVQEYSNVVRTAQTDPQVKQRLLSAANSAP